MTARALAAKIEQARIVPTGSMCRVQASDGRSIAGIYTVLVAGDDIYEPVGTNPDFDLAIQSKPAIDAFLQQPIEQSYSWPQTMEGVSEVQHSIERLGKALVRRPPPAANPQPPSPPGPSAGGR